MNEEHGVIIRTGVVGSKHKRSDVGFINVKISKKSVEAEAFPLLPKMFKSTPKEGETVLIISMREGNTSENLFYIGPVIVNPQDFEEAKYESYSNVEDSVIKGDKLSLKPEIREDSRTWGSFPNDEDVAVEGRNGEDIILKNGEIDIRCGIRVPLDGNVSKDMDGNIMFNQNNPSFIQLKKASGSLGSLVNVVGDGINFISNNALMSVADNANKKDNSSNYDLIKNELIERLLEKNELHPVVKGDKLVELLAVMIDAFFGHFHHYFGPKEGTPNTISAGEELESMKKLKEWRGTLSEILSKNTRTT